MGKIRKLAVRSYRKELKNFIEILEEIGIAKVSNFLVYGAWIRVMLEIEEKLPTFKEEDGSINPELHSYPILLDSIQKWASSFLKQNGHKGKWLGLSIWIHTLRGILRPELMPLVKQMWDLLLESKPHWDESLKILREEDLSLGIESSMVNKTEIYTRKILNTLPPKQIG